MDYLTKIDNWFNALDQDDQDRILEDKKNKDSLSLAEFIEKFKPSV